MLFAFISHSSFLKWGLRIQNALGILGIFSLLVLTFSGLLAWLGILKLRGDRVLPSNFDHPWAGSRYEANAFVTGMYSVLW